MKNYSLTWAAAKRGSTFSGHFSSPMPTLSYQVKGARLVAYLNVLDMVEVVVDESGQKNVTVTPECAPALLQDSYKMTMTNDNTYSCSSSLAY